MTVAEDTVTYSTMPGALRSATAQLLNFNGRPEWLFLFPDLVSDTLSPPFNLPRISSSTAVAGIVGPRIHTHLPATPD
jgi:hypothetical protein